MTIWPSVASAALAETAVASHSLRNPESGTYRPHLAGGDSGEQVCLNAPIADPSAAHRSAGNLTAVACSVEDVRLEGDQVTSMPWDAQAALCTIVADPRCGPPALSGAQKPRSWPLIGWPH